MTSMFAFDTTTVVTQGLVAAAAVVLLAWLWQALAELTSIEERLMQLPLPVKHDRPSSRFANSRTGR